MFEKKSRLHPPHAPKVTIWLTGLSGAGKTTIGQALADRLRRDGSAVAVLDGDLIRLGLCSDLGYSAEDRHENVRRVAEAADLFRGNGVYPIVCLMSPTAVGRDLAKRLARNAFVEVFVDTPLDVCQHRDPKGLYARYDAGEVHGIPGLDMEYEAPENPSVTVYPATETVDECVSKIIRAVVSLRL